MGIKMEKAENKPALVCVGLPTWEGDYLKSTVQLMSELAKNYRVLYVEYTRTVKDTNGLKKAELREITLANGATVHVLTPASTLPINWLGNHFLYAAGLTLNAFWLKKDILKAMQLLKMQQPLVVNAFQPGYGLKLLGKLDEVSTTYYCYDEIGEAAWCKKHGKRYEENYISKVNQVIVSSSALLEKKIRLQPHSFLVKNGVDLSVFAMEKTPKSTKKTIGYVGTIDSRIDVTLLEKTIKQFPENQFLFIGRILDKSVFSILNRFKNVHFEGAKTADELPKYIEKIDVGLIPFKKNAFTRHIYPLKINEYLASGMPVVTTPFADLTEFSSCVYIGNKQDFIEKLARALEENDMEIMQKRMALAQQNTWAQRATQFSMILNQNLPLTHK